MSQRRTRPHPFHLGYAALLLAVGAPAAAGCRGEQFWVDLTVELPAAARVPLRISLSITELDGPGVPLGDPDVEERAGGIFFSDPGTSNRVLIIPRPGTHAVHVDAIAYDVGDQELARGSVTVVHAPRIVTATLTIDGGPAPAPPGCPDVVDEILVTNVLDEAEGTDYSGVDDVGGAGDVSLREALLIDAAAGGGNAIRFDPGVFPPVGGATIYIDAALGQLPLLMAGNTCIDGVGASVTITSTLTTGAILSVASAGNTIANVEVAGDATGIDLASDQATGTLITHCTVRGNPNDGIYVAFGADGNTIGPGNTIIGNLYGIRVDGQVSGLTIVGNYIGVSAAFERFPNNLDGINLGECSNITIARNTIGGNSGSGIFIPGSADGIVIQGNLIGGDVVSEETFGNDGDGICVVGAVGVQITEHNVIAANGAFGLDVDFAATNVLVSANHFCLNDAGAIRMGGNSGILPPVITSFDGTTIMGTVTPTCGATCGTVEIFGDGADEACAIVALAVSVAMDGTWSAVLPDVGGYAVLTATYTDNDQETSALSAPVSAD
jgi:parallel beta-helix repeat protein